MISSQGLKVLSLLFLTLGISTGYAQVPLSQWHLGYQDSLQGAHVLAAKEWLKQKRLKPQKQSIVAIIDSGVDSTTRDIQAALWRNVAERIDGVDNDDNGYIDDLHGWNFLGTRDGVFDMTSAGREEFREFKRLYPIYKHGLNEGQSSPEQRQEYAYYLEMRRRARIDRYLQYYVLMQKKDCAYKYIDSVLRNGYISSRDTLTRSGLMALPIEEANYAEQAELIITDLLRASPQTKWTELLAQHAATYETVHKRILSIEQDPDKRLLIGDNLKDALDTRYGNNHLSVPGYEHGNFVAGVISAQGKHEPAVLGVYPQAKLMILRAVPDGDEYDKDISSAIRYAVDQGADIINMSLGKYTSPDYRMVDEAIRYAEGRGVLVLHAAGNDALNLDSVAYYPQARDNGRLFSNFIRVGASTKLGTKLKSSNYSKRWVDIFAPGEEISSFLSGNKVDISQGTSIACPIVSGVAAMIKSYFPNLQPYEIKSILCQTARPRSTLQDYAASGIVDALAAVQRAYELSLSTVDSTHLRATMATEQYLAPWVRGQFVLPKWIGDTEYFYYHTSKGKGNTYYFVNAKQGKKEALISDVKTFIKSYHTLTGDSSLREDNFKLSGLKFDTHNPQCFYITRAGKTLMYDRRSKRLVTHDKAIPQQSGGLPKQDRDLSASGHYQILGLGYDLYVRNLNTGTLHRLTHDGDKDASYTYRYTTDTIRHNARGFWLGEQYICLMQDERSIPMMSTINALSQPRPQLRSIRMPLPYEEGYKRYKLICYDAPRAKLHDIDISRFPKQELTLQQVKEDPSSIYVLQRSHDAKSIVLSRLDFDQMRLKELIKEEIEPHTNLTLFNYRVIDNGRKIVWWSERSGYGRYYLYDRDGQLLNQITKGDKLVAGSILSVDVKRNLMIFSAYGVAGHNPYYRHYYKVGLDGKNQVRLTQGDYMHEAELSPNQQYLINDYSRMDQPPAWQLISVQNPKKVYELEACSAYDLRKNGWQAPRLVQLKASDRETDLYGLMYLPSNLDPSKKYPVITHVYPGPQDDQVPREFTLDSDGNQSLAELGFVVLQIAPRGSSPLRGKDFYCYGYGNLRDYALADTKHIVESLAKEYSYIDLDRVGIYGHSGGGFLTVAAMLTYPDFFKVGVSASGNHDNRVYIDWWAEVFHGSKSIPTNMELAHNLRGKLMLMTGDMDSNVPMASTLRMADALIKANKRFDFFIFPGKNHALDSPYYYNCIKQYFVDNLLNYTPSNVNMLQINK